MANDYFNHENPLTRHTLGRAEQVNSTFNAIEAAFDKLPSPDQINRGSVAYVTDIGTVNSYVVNFARVPESYTEGMNFTMKAATTNTGPAVINVNGLGAKQIRRYDGQPLEPGDIRAGQLVILGYDGSRFLNIGAQGAEVAKARQWATSTSVVQSGEYGARGYAQQADRWANANEDVVVEGGRFSAKHWALKAMSNAGLLPDENLDIPSRSYRDLGTAAEKFRDGNFSRNVSAAAFVGSGAGLTNLNASNISSGTLPNARLSGDYSFGSLTLSGGLITGGSIRVNGDNIYIRSDSTKHLWFRDSTDTSHGVLYVGGSNGPLVLRVHDASGSPVHQLELARNGRATFTGTIHGNGSGLTNLNASNITSGTLPAARLPNHSADLLTSGTLPNARLNGNYSFGSLTLSGSLTAASVSGNGSGLTNLNASNITSGTLPAARLPNHSADLLTSGTLPNARLNGNYSFGSLTLSGTLNTSDNITAPRIRLTVTTDASLTSTNHAFQIGPTNGGNLIMDGNEIIARNNGAAATLNLNLDGGLVRIGNGGLEVGGNPVATVSTTGSASTTNFPVGHVIYAGISGSRPARNESRTARFGSDDTQYRFGDGSGAVLSGTWRARGEWTGDTCVIQRTA